MKYRLTARVSWPALQVCASFVLAMLAKPASAEAQSVSGTLAVKKIVVNQVGPSATIPALFNTTTHCTPNAASPQSHTPVNVAAGQTVIQSTTMAPGIYCSVTETVPPPISGLSDCKGSLAVWTASYSPLVTIVTGQTATLTVTNTLACAPSTSTFGSLGVFKNVVNNLGVPTPATFAMVASCAGMTAVSLTVPAGQSLSVSNSVPGGTVCSVSETLPPRVNVRACPSGTASWVETNPGPATVQTAQSTVIIITNTLTCDPVTPRRGQLRIIKTVVNRAGGSVILPATYPMSVTCTPNGPTNLSVNVAPGSPGTLVTVPAPSQCVVTEAPLPPIMNVRECRSGTASWSTVGSPSAPVTVPPGGVVTVSIRNVLNCTNPPQPECVAPTQNDFGCRITVVLRRTRGAPVYSIVISPAATHPSVNAAPHTAGSCVIGSNAGTNLATCWFNYVPNSTPVTLTATSSTGTIPAGFIWHGACSGTTGPTCTLTATPGNKTAYATFP